MPRIAFRAFKAERVLEIWGSKRDRGPYHLLATYPIAAMSGQLGPKSAEGDMQVPEGFYSINRFNPRSAFHLSLGLNDPNSSDRRRVQTGRRGEDIFIHGNHVSAGCLAMTDPVIDVIYRLALHARASGQRSIPATIFPCRMDTAKWSLLCRQYAGRRDLIEFWSTLRPAYAYFERTHLWPRPHVDKHGKYVWPKLG
jgi:murein L,D-transpeptidase YafK